MAVLLIICRNFLAETLSLEALDVELYLLFIMVKAATCFDHQLASWIAP